MRHLHWSLGDWPIACWTFFALSGVRLQAQAPAEQPAGYPVAAVPFKQVVIADTFWSPRIETSRTVTIPYAFEQCEKTGRIRNFARAGGLLEGEFEGAYPFDDSDVYKIIEGAAYALHLRPDPKLDAYVDDLIAKIAAAQEDDGYLYTARTLKCARLHNWYGDKRWEKEEGSHELYNAGHLFEAACAHFEATGKRNFLEVALKLAARIDADFGPEREQKPPGHQGIEIGLCRLYQVTGDKRWLALAQFLLEVRGVHKTRKSWGEYCQDHLPVLQQKEAVGHAVRAAYMYAGMADVAALSGDLRWAKAIDVLWDDVVGRKVYVTGGIGATGAGEAFGKAYELPNASAYCETCAAIANVFWNHRLFLRHGHARYIDVLERSLYNNCLSGIALDGKHFFYPNPLASFGGAERSPWFGCACCPSNDARFVPSLGRYAYAQRGNDLFVNLYVAGSVRVTMPSGPVQSGPVQSGPVQRSPVQSSPVQSSAVESGAVESSTVELQVATRYPWDGAVRVTVQCAEPRKFRLRLRVPGWARGEPVPSDLYAFADKSDAKVNVKVSAANARVTVADYADVEAEWKAGDTVDLDLPMPIRRLRAHPNVADCAGRVALQRGPLVYCVEGVDTKSGQVASLYLGDDVALAATPAPDVLGGVTLLRGVAGSVRRTADGVGREPSGSVPFAAIPYYAWAHRGRTPMAVWLATTPEAAVPGPAPTLALRAKKTASHNGNLVDALSDQMDVIAPGDKSRPFFHWWNRLGGVEWVQYDFDAAATVRGCEVYWLRDLPHGACDAPASWRVLYRDGETWKPVAARGDYGTEAAVFNRAEWTPVTTRALRLEVQCKPKLSAGVHEWRLLEGN